MSRPSPVSDAVHRHWAMLRLIPRSPRKIDAGRLERLLAQQGIDVHRRSIQRDLEALSRVFVDLRRDDRSKPYGWSWNERSASLEVPGMGVGPAVTFELLREHLSAVLPHSTFRALGPHFKRAREVLAQSPNAKMARWPAKVRVAPRGQPLQAPNVLPSVLEAVYTGLLEERRLVVHYCKRGADSDSEYEVSPLGLVLRSGTMVLVGTFWKYQNISQMLLHRMSHAEVIDERVVPPKGFRLDRYIESGGLGFRCGKAFKLELLVHELVARTLRETPLGKDQKLTAHDEEYLRLRVTVPDTVELRTWLQGHGPMIEVVKPVRLRREFAEAARRMAGRHGVGAA
ncbi:MAG: WYL domain-containing protein [Deltaproteobacteria bacterium]|nr:MAG: WYL domain-containing protein [Deltaproteobacteria bacterium]